MSARDWAFLAGFWTCVAMDLVWAFGRGFVGRLRDRRIVCVLHGRKAVAWFNLTRSGHKYRGGACGITGCTEAAMADLRRLAGIA